MISVGMIGPGPGERLWTEQVEPLLDDYMGGVFESVCRDFVRRGGGLPFQPIRVGEWWDAGSQNEIDVVALGAAKQLLAGECKWSNVGSSDLAKLRARTNLLLQTLEGGPHQVHLAIFSGGTIAPETEEVQAGRVLRFPAESLYSELSAWGSPVGATTCSCTSRSSRESPPRVTRTMTGSWSLRSAAGPM